MDAVDDDDDVLRIGLDPPKLVGPQPPRPGGWTASEWARQQFPPCPNCGTTVEVDRVGGGTLSGEALYIDSRWRCPRNCDLTKARRTD